MRIRKTFRCIVRATALACLASQSASAATDYTLTPRFRNGALVAVGIDLSLTAGAAGRTTIDLPDHSVGQERLWRGIQNLSVSGSHARLLPGGSRTKIIVRSDPHARVAIHYDVVQDWKGAPGQNEASYQRAVVQPGYFHLLGSTVFALASSGDKEPVTFRFGPAPNGWTLASTLERAPLTIKDIRASVTVGGDWRVLRSGPLRVALRGEWHFSDADFVRRARAIVDTEQAYWGDAPAPYLITVLPLASNGITGTAGGEGLDGGFAFFLTPALARSVDDSRIVYGLAHERMHTWIPAQLGAWPKSEPQGTAWLTEGFTDYFARRVLLGSRIWRLDGYVSRFNALLHDYDVSPVRTAPNARIAREFFSNPDIQQLPYQRGSLMAAYWDWRLRKAAIAGGMNAIIHDMRTRGRARPGKTADENFVAAMAAHGVDVRGDITRFIEHGEQIWLPRDTFAPCGTVATARIPVFTYGFDAAATATNGQIVKGADPNGPAYAAGLRDGMKIVARLSPPDLDSRIRRVYRVLDRGRTRDIGYLPAAKTSIAVQSFIANSRQACSSVLGG
ncbi:MAG TPA: hypothetical protein VN932_04950 [Rhizomicrobium sp.]|nr:hypothetical protein [Rhizomicrobium sp.]